MVLRYNYYVPGFKLLILLITFLITLSDDLCLYIKTVFVLL